ncbi:hypothetical protein XaC1_373 [Xanthomonas phage XaC1]|nr:hypothetical protein XaC1_373 [Xanthomonas phage XaC1]
MKKVIMLYDYTGIMAKPWLDNGYEVWSFDGQHPAGITKDGNHNKVGMWFDAYDTTTHVKEIAEMVGDNVVFLFGFPECTNIAVSGAKHFDKKLKANPAVQAEAVELARLVMYLGDYLNVPWGLENPVSVMSTIWRKADFSFHPYEYGGYLPVNDVHPLYPAYIAPRDAYPKKTCIWCGNGFKEPVKAPVPCPPGYSAQQLKLGGKSTKTKNIRSATPRSFAEAVYQANK